ncbi:hypothetical protein COA17_11250 [Sphingomonas ginsenosidimutans]|jgi:hypothetical protein|uniref:Uncharacterized protein n=1 Tax=Sphingomonas ginsenosidimutans TaxID=862134 RepID=A0A2A4HWI7_9SPHN|nr:hypothetical protein COA17_11250 [Sphingomonas ginsenosidimutans]
MICFRDRTFCTAACATQGCEQRLTSDVSAAARAWWGTPGAPIAVADRSASCADFTPDGSGSRPEPTPVPITSTPAAVTAGAHPRKPETRP